MLEKTADVVRGLAADIVEKSGSGHPGMPIGCADIGAVLFGEIMNYDPTKPEWKNRDRFVLSAGHGSAWLYSFLHLAGYQVSLDDLKNFRQLDSKTPGHPEYKETSGVDTTTGPLGQGFANAVGMAVSERMLAERYNTSAQEIISHYTYTLLGDGCMMEGITSEAASLAGHLGLGKLIAIYDDNQISIEGDIEITFTESVADRFKAYDWQVIKGVDGNNPAMIKAAIEEAKVETERPTLIQAETVIAYGSPEKAGTAAAHGAPLGAEEVKGLKANLNLPVDKKFYIPKDIKAYFGSRKKELIKQRQEWEGDFNEWANSNTKLKANWEEAHNLEVPEDLSEVVNELELDTPRATRKSSGPTLRKLADEVPYLVGGSADLAPSTKTYLDDYGEIQADKFSGRNFRFGVREHAMGAIANGIALHGGLRPFTATFLVFSDYMRPAIRMAALMEKPVVYVFTHDSIYIGEDGPTHQPVEQLESLRLIPNLEVIRPADEEETKIAWLQAVERTEGPTALILTRQDLPHLDKENGLSGVKNGGYVIKEGNNPEVVLVGSGSEVSLAVEVSELLGEQGYESKVVSIPDRGKFIEQNSGYISNVLGSKDKFRVILEAGRGQGWCQLNPDHLVTVEEFGLSGPGSEVGAEFGFAADKITEEIISKLRD